MLLLAAMQSRELPPRERAEIPNKHAAMDNTAGRIEARLQQVGTDHSRHCFGKTPMQTLRGVAHVVHEKSLCERAPGGPPTG